MGGVFGAFANLWRGFWSIFIRDMAVANPEAAYAGAIAELKDKKSKILAAASAVRGERNRKQAELDKVKIELAQTETELKGAVQRNLQQAGTALLKKKRQLEARRTDLETVLGRLNDEVKRIVRDLKSFEGEIFGLQEEARRNIARLRSAQAMSKLNEMLDGLSVDSTGQMLEGLRESIESEVAKVEIQRELRGSDLDAELAEAREAGTAAQAQDEFAAMRAQFEASQGTASVDAGAPAGDGTNTGKSV